MDLVSVFRGLKKSRSETKLGGLGERLHLGKKGKGREGKGEGGREGGGGRDSGRESPSSLCIPEERLPSLHSPPSQPRDPYGAAGEGGEKTGVGGEDGTRSGGKGLK